jgi:hypothetical protein
LTLVVDPAGISITSDPWDTKPWGSTDLSSFAAMARSHSQCEVLHQDFLAMQLPESRFDGVFANASLFHVPSQELPKVLLELFYRAISSRGSRPFGARASPPGCAVPPIRPAMSRLCA